MRYLLGLLLPIAIQAMLALIIIVMNTGNGSFAGLGAIIIAMVVIPATAIVNGLYIRTHQTFSFSYVMTRCYLFALIAPILLPLTLII